MKPSAVRAQTDGASECKAEECCPLPRCTPTVGLYLKPPVMLAVGSCYFYYSHFGVVGVVLRAGVGADSWWGGDGGAILVQGFECSQIISLCCKCNLMQVALLTYF